MAAYELHQIQLIIEDAFPFPPPEYDLSFRRMFGGLGLYVRGRIFAIVTDEGLAFKLDDYAQGELREDAPDAHTLSWTKKYLIAPPNVVDDRDRLSDWIQRSVEYVVTLPPGKGKKRA